MIKYFKSQLCATSKLDENAYSCPIHTSSYKLIIISLLNKFSWYA